MPEVRVGLREEIQKYVLSVKEPYYQYKLNSMDELLDSTM